MCIVFLFVTSYCMFTQVFIERCRIHYTPPKVQWRCPSLCGMRELLTGPYILGCGPELESNCDRRLKDLWTSLGRPHHTTSVPTNCHHHRPRVTIIPSQRRLGTPLCSQNCSVFIFTKCTKWIFVKQRNMCFFFQTAVLCLWLIWKCMGTKNKYKYFNLRLKVFLG